MKKIGIIVSKPAPPNHLIFYFLIEKENDVTVGTYIEVPMGEMILFGKISNIESRNTFYENLENIQSLVEAGSSIEQRFITNNEAFECAKVRIMQIIKGEEIDAPNRPPMPGEYVYEASKTTIRKIFHYSKEDIEIGKIDQTDHEVFLNHKKVTREHLLITGSTGSGKTNTAGILIYGMVKKGYTVIIIDTHDEYEKLLQKIFRKEQTENLKKEIIVKLIPQEYLKEEVGNSRSLTIKFSSLSADQIVEMTHISGIGVELVHFAYNIIRKTKKDYSLEEFILKVEEVATEYKFTKNTFFPVKRNLNQLGQLKILGEGIDLKKLIEEKSIIIVDVSFKLSERVRRTIVGCLTEELAVLKKEEIITDDIILLIEEAHRYIPARGSIYSAKVLREIAREGRKFGIGLVISTQMVRNLDPVTISQCNTKVIHRLHNKSDLEAIVPHSNTIFPDEFNRVPYFPDGIAFVSGEAITLPTVIKVPNISEE